MKEILNLNIKDLKSKGAYSILSKDLKDKGITFKAEGRGQKNKAFALDENDVTNFEIFTEYNKQFIVFQLATLLDVPVAPIFKDNKLNSWFSEDAKEQIKTQDSYSKEEKKLKFELNSFILGLVFNDGDHKIDHNEKKGVFFDFDLACIYFSDEKIKMLRGLLQERFKNENDYYINDFDLKMRGSFFKEIKVKIENFNIILNSEEGVNFMRLLIKKSEYKGHDSEEIRLSILKWTGIVLVELNKFIKDFV